MSAPLPGSDFWKLQRYNALDCCATFELNDLIDPQLGNGPVRETYNLARDLQAPALSMMLRGILVNRNLLASKKATLHSELDILRRNLQYLNSGLGWEARRPKSAPRSWTPILNPNSDDQLKDFFYEFLSLPVQYKYANGQKRVSVDRASLEKLSEKGGPLAKFIVPQVLAYRDRVKLLQVLKSGIDPDGRLRASFNIAGTSTFRWSSSTNAFHGGTNLQNITEELRELFIADPGYKLVNIDFEQVDARFVALDAFRRTGRDGYLKACEKGDLHTGTAMMMWQDLPWTDDPKRNREIADVIFYRHFSRRFMCKKLGHGSNYDLSGIIEDFAPKALAAQSFIPLPDVRDFQSRYYATFPEILDWKYSVVEELQTTKTLETVWGARRQFHGRVRDRDTWKEAFSYIGQGSTAGLANRAVLRTHVSEPEAQLLMQGHDSVLIQIPEAAEEYLVPRLLKCFQFPATVTHPIEGPRTHIIPVDAKVGWNWGEHSPENPDGLIKWRGPGADTRSRYYDPSVSILDRRLR